ncbi:MAG: ComEC/Rec2 family competence protein [Cypionkella sp.]|uniref:ComEC/Rec2 family competence protein n=1 Tax=Cypionkella sp. TaxID=2811411 RepID=UPI002ABA4A8F|nr:ComEC/Rec2 family competence protein [Cypionkella sp.]MDZ4312665.1 ComEC/Rec2 family competence protein [Cypionkella sp.]
MRILRWPLQVLAEARGLLFPWVPVFLGCGIALWFALPFEPDLTFYAAGFAAFLALIVIYRLGLELLHPPLVILACLLAGVLAAGLRAHLVAAPMLEHRYYGAVQGRVIHVDRSQSDALRITLDHVVLQDMPRDKTPLNVRISLHGQEISVDPRQVVLLTASLAAPEGPAEPGGFDFRRMAYFQQLGAVGYTRSPVLLWAEAAPGTQAINRLRTDLSRAMIAAVPSEAGAFATGAMTGDRSAISLDTVQALRDSNLAHLLAISGMNMAFITGFVFALLRYGLATIPAVALRVNSKKVAAVAAFAVALFYLLLSGANVATVRAFLMVCVMLGAVLLDRRALTMRSVALAAVVLLLLRPESLLEPGFQLSFAATVVLIAGFQALNRQILRERLPRWLMPVFTLVLTSVLAGAATAPFAAATFNRFTDYGLLANLLTVPMMSLLMAAGVLAALLAPVGLAAPALWLMEQAGRWILFIAHWVAGLDGAVTAIIRPGPMVIPLLTFAGVWAILWRGNLRWAAAVPLAVSLVLWSAATRPTLLISGDGALVGLMGAGGRALSVERGARFAAQNWLQSDGDLAVQPEAYARPGFSGPKGARAFVLDGWRSIALSGKAAGEAVITACAQADVVIIPAAAAPVVPGPQGCLVIDRNMLDQTGALALSVRDGRLQLHPARDVQRIWMADKPIWQDRSYAKPRARLAHQ